MIGAAGQAKGMAERASYSHTIFRRLVDPTLVTVLLESKLAFLIQYTDSSSSPRSLDSWSDSHSR